MQNSKWSAALPISEYHAGRPSFVVFLLPAGWQRLQVVQDPLSGALPFGNRGDHQVGAPHAGDIERRKLRGDFGITYDADALKLIDDLKTWGLSVCAVVITRFNNQPSVRTFINRLERRDVKVYTHRAIEGYPSAVDTIVSDLGYGSNACVETTKPVVVVTGQTDGRNTEVTSSELKPGTAVVTGQKADAVG